MVRKKSIWLRRQEDFLIDPDEELEILNDFVVGHEDRQEDYSDFLSTPEWQELRQKAFERDKFKCQGCGTEYNLQVHHLEYSRNRLKEKLSNLVTLCSDCHELEHE